MNKRTGRFLLLEGIVIIFLLLLGQFYMYPLAGKAALEPQMEKSLSMYPYRRVLEADIGSSVIYILEIEGNYCEKMFDKSLVFSRYVEKPLVLLRPVAETGKEYQFVARDSANDLLYTVDNQEALHLLKKEQNGVMTIGFSIIGATVILMGISFGGKKKEEPRASA